jgi:hypothetical protein
MTPWSMKEVIPSGLENWLIRTTGSRRSKTKYRGRERHVKRPKFERNLVTYDKQPWKSGEEM